MKTAKLTRAERKQVVIEFILIIGAVVGFVAITASYYSGPIMHFLNSIG